MARFIVLAITHALALAGGFAAGIYALPILTAPEAPALTEVEAYVGKARYTGRFRRDLPGSDLLHWGEGEVAVNPDVIALMGELSPGPDYKLYLAPEFVSERDAFIRIKDRALRVGDVRTFTNFIVIPAAPVDIDAYDTVVIWCESFGQFITAARYR